MSRTLERSIARREYDKFAKKWRTEKRLAGVYGQGGYRRPSFSEWYHMHQKDIQQMRESTPADVQEHMGLDPWAPIEMKTAPEKPHEESDRGVVTIDMATGEEERDD